MAGPWSGAVSRRLFNYIAGANQADLEIVMTTPVLMSLEGSRRRMGFILPVQVARQGAWIQEQGLSPQGGFQLAGCDPPFLPGFLRRNEILVRVGQ